MPDQSWILDLIGTTEPLAEVLARLASITETRFPGMKCRISVLQGNGFQHGDPSFDLEAEARSLASWECPIFSHQGKLLGRISLRGAVGQRFGMEERVALEGCARVAAVAIERRESERQIERLGQFYAALSETNKAILRSVGMGELFPEVCRIAVEQGRLRMAWIGWLQSTTGRVLPLASSGEERGYLDRVQVVARPGAEPRCMVGAAIQRAKPVVCNDLATDPLGEPIRAELVRSGFRSGASLALRRGAEVVGAMTLFAAEADFFDARLMSVLEEMAQDISYALGAFEKEALRRDAEASRRQLAHAVEQSPAATVITDIGGRIEYVNPKFTEVAGYTLEEVRGKTPAVINSGLTSKEVYDELWRTIRSGREWRGEMQNRKKSGELYWEKEVISPLKDERGRIVNFIAVKEDITERKRTEAELLRMNRTLRMISQCNQVLVSASEESHLLQSICEVIVRTGGYPYAWVGYNTGDSEEVTPVAQAGHGEWNEETTTSAISLPLKIRDIPGGVLAIYAAEPEAFSADEMRLLREMADDLAYGINALRANDERKQAEEDVKNLLIEEENILENTQVGIAFLRQGRVARCNSAFAAMFGYSKDEVVGMPAHELHASDVQPRQGGNFSGDLQVRRRDGSVFWAAHNLTAAPVGDDPAAHAIWIVQDIDARKRAEEAMRIRDRAIESSINGIMITDSCAPDHPVIYVNPAFERITGYSAGEAMGRSGRFLVLDDLDQPGLNEVRSALREGRAAQVVMRCYRKDGSPFWNELSVSQVRDGGGQITHVVSILNDVTERVRFEEDLAHQSTHDSLTGLANRNLLEDRLEQSIAHAARYERTLAVIYVDIDHFKMVNESLGHRTGDELIRLVARRLEACVRDLDTVARASGDQFAMLLSDVQAGEEAAAILGIKEAMNTPFRLAGQDIYLSCTIGASFFPKDGQDGKTLLKNADAAMHNAKEQGRNQVSLYAAGMNAPGERHLTLVTGLRHALENSEFRVYYQPLVQLSTGAIVGAEALVRWRHPDVGFVPPGDFIRVAEETGLILPIGQWVLETACEQNARWQREGLQPITVAVNLSPRQFNQDDLTTLVRNTLVCCGLQPHWLELELTESMLMKNVATATEILRNLSGLGVRLSLDDFGTGYSSLSYLKRFPFNKLKIDQSFVRDLTRDPDDAAIVTAVIAIARSMNLKVVAEGVETVEQVGYLQRHNCDQMQGFYFSKPLTAEDFGNLLRGGKRA